ncbi:MAG: hypothetical protein K8R41_01040 [Bacteroidales bacterium]|nr:hypothetical protein [Bacteroidales bacterium]
MKNVIKTKFIRSALLKSRNNIIGLLLLLVFCVSNISFAQKGSKPMRIEINSRIDNNAFNIIPCKDKGVLLMFKTIHKTDDGKAKWVFTLFNKEMKEIWTQEIPLQEDVAFKKYVSDEKFSYLLFHNSGKKGSAKFNLQILKYSLIKESFTLVSENIPDKAEVVDIKVYKKKAYLGLQLRKDKIELNIIDLISGELVQMPVVFKNKNILSAISVNKIKKRVGIVLTNFESRNKNKMYLVEFKLDGTFVGSTEIKTEKNDYVLNYAKLYINKKGENILIGTYSIDNVKISDLKDEDEIKSSGFYISKVADNEQKYIRFYNFLDFENFYGSHASRNIVILKKRAKRQNKDNKDFSIDYNLIMHDIYETDSNLVLIAELYYAKYHTVTNFTYDYYGNSIPYTYQIFDGYSFFNTIITGFDDDGNIEWNHGFEIKDLISFDIEKHISPLFIEEDILIAYNRNGQLASKIFYKGEVIGNLEYFDLEPKYKKDFILDEKNSNMIHWYNNYFLCYGYQMIRNNSLAKKNKRTVFYMNKIRFN